MFFGIPSTMLPSRAKGLLSGVQLNPHNKHVCQLLENNITDNYSIDQIKSEPGTTPIKSQPKTGATASQAAGIPASMLTVSALPSMDETVASTQQPLITPVKRKHEDEDDDYDS